MVLIQSFIRDLLKYKYKHKQRESTTYKILYVLYILYVLFVYLEAQNLYCCVLLFVLSLLSYLTLLYFSGSFVK